MRELVEWGWRKGRVGGREGCARVGLEEERVGLEEEKGCEGTDGVGLEKGKGCERLEGGVGLEGAEEGMGVRER